MSYRTGKQEFAPPSASTARRILSRAVAPFSHDWTAHPAHAWRGLPAALTRLLIAETIALGC